MIAINRAFFAYLDDVKLVTILIPYYHFNGHSDSFSLITKDQAEIPLLINQRIPLKKFMKYVCELPFEVPLGERYEIQNSNGYKTDLQIGAVIRTKDFDENYYYEGDDLGVTYSKEFSSFKLWAPIATSVKLKLIDPNRKELPHVEMARGEKGVWHVKLEGNYDRFEYSYLVCNNLLWKEAVDPYAKAVSTNGEMGVIIDLEQTRVPFTRLQKLQSPVDAIIYETHIRDFSIHPESGIQHKGKYLGLTEEAIGTDRNSTGLSYLKELGITHLELLPFNDFYGVDEARDTGEYNWGYNPLHYNVPDGSYSTDPSDPYKRIIELKTMITSIQSKGIYVIMDVVYNHVYHRETSHFEKIVPGYYFRHDDFGMPSNGTGVGNDIASERKMVRKFIVDSIKYWMKEFNVDGFRFDLMGILDIETMCEVRKTADDLKEGCIILGEGWDLNTPLASDYKATIKNAKKMPGIAFFNDYFRDTVKGSTFNLYERGYIHGSSQKSQAVKHIITGSIQANGSSGLFSSPEQSINYVESHDNHTLWDRINLFDPKEATDIKRKRHRLATGMVILSQGVPFIHSGQEFFRTKHGIENSYKSPDSVNQLDWSEKIRNFDHVQYIKGLISIRKAHGAFRLRSAKDIEKYMKLIDSGFSSILYLLENVEQFGPWKNIFVAFHHLETSREIFLPIKGTWQMICNDQAAGTKPLNTITEHKFTLEPLSMYVLVQESS